MSTSRLRMLGAVGLAAVAIAAAGCSGGSDDGGDSADAGPAGAPGALIPPAEGASPELSATEAIAALGAPSGVSAEESGATLSGLDEFGLPADIFEQQVREEPGATGAVGEPSDGVGAPAAPDGPPPINGDALVAAPPAEALPPGNGAAPTAPEPPAESPRALEADFDVSGEPIIAREGDTIPPDTQQFEVDRVNARSVVLVLVGGLLPDGSDRVTLDVGESITLFNATADRTYRIKLVAVRAA